LEAVTESARATTFGFEPLPHQPRLRPRGTQPKSSRLASLHASCPCRGMQDR